MPMTALGISGVAGLGSAVIGGVTAGNAQAAAQEAALKAAKQYLALTVPDPKEQQLILEQYQNTGKMDPRLAHAFQQSGTNLSKISTDPALESAQMSALSSLENEANNGGHTLSQDAYLNQLQQKVNAENAGREGAIEQSFAEKGMGRPSGLMLSAQEQNNQNMTQKENDASMKAAEMAQNNALQALQSEGDLATKVRGQNFDQASTVAKAQDSIDNFNSQMNQGVENQNVAAQNKANAYNVENTQNISNANTDIENKQQQYNKTLVQQQYDNELKKAGGAAAGYEGQAGQYNNQATTDANMWGNIGQGAIKTGGGVAQYLGNKKSPYVIDEES